MNFSKDKHIIIPLALAFAAIVGFRAWHDMHQPPKPAMARFDAFYFVKNDAELAPFTTNPDDERVLVVWAGDIATAKDGSLKLKSTPVSPLSIPQREIIPLYTLDRVPSSSEALAKLLEAATEKWREAGDLINDIYIEPPADKKSLATLIDETNNLRHDMKEEYWLGVYTNKAAIESLTDRVNRLEDAGKSIRTLIVETNHDIKPGEKLEDFIRAVDKISVLPFMLQMDKHPDFDRLQHTLQPQPERFSGFVLAASAADNNTLR